MPQHHIPPMHSEPNRQPLAKTWLFLVILVPLLAWIYRSRGNPAFAVLKEEELRQTLGHREVLVIGGGHGIGAALVHALVKRGTFVTLISEHFPKDETLLKGVDFIRANTSTMRGAQELITKQLKGRVYDTVVFCNGFVTRPVLGTPPEGMEEDVTTSYLSRFIMVNELADANAMIGRKRMYILGYPGDDTMLSNFEDTNFAWNDYKTIPSHLNTVLFNDALIQEAAARNPDLHIFGVNPGFISNGIRNINSGFLLGIVEGLLSLVLKSANQYVEKSLVQLIATPELDSKSGVSYSSTCEELPPKKWMSKPGNRVTVWDNSMKMVHKALG